VAQDGDCPTRRCQPGVIRWVTEGFPMSIKKIMVLAGAGAACVAIPLATAPAAMASTGSTTYLSANLTQLNQTGASAHVDASLTGNQLTISITNAWGMTSGLAHAQQIRIGGTNTCPAWSQQGKGAGNHLRTTDALKNYGTAKVSLTTSGDTSAASGPGNSRFPVGDASYNRTFTVPTDVAAQIRGGHGVVVRHGIDYNWDGTYDGAATSDLNPALPEEATDPAVCGVLAVNQKSTVPAVSQKAAGPAASQMTTMPKGGVNTGYATTTDSTDPVALAGGAAAIALGGVGVILMRRRTHDTSLLGSQSMGDVDDTQAGDNE